MLLQCKPCLVCGQPIFDTPLQLQIRKVCSPSCRTKLRNCLEVVQQRFWPLVEKTDGCWLWKGKLFGNNDYGAFHYRGKHMAAHRFSWVLHMGLIAGGLDVLHACDVPVCVNPAHLFLGTPADNAADRDGKGRTARGERSAAAKLTSEQVVEMRRLWASGVSTRKLGQLFGVSHGTAYRAVAGKQWRHVD